jgi:uncharacterized phage protein (TIGR01671 family)
MGGRQILFRGKSIESGKWAFGYLVVLKDLLDDENPTNIIGRDTGRWYQVIPETFGQFTGLTDKNGVKIFEGDIVMVGSGWGEQATIVYDDSCARFMVEFKVWGRKGINVGVNFEVIGNIHDKEQS